jgi:hypothetical protein
MNELKVNQYIDVYQLTGSTFNELPTNSLIPPSQKKSKNPSALKKKNNCLISFSKLLFSLYWDIPNFILHFIPQSMIISKHLIKKLLCSFNWITQC